jgi:hypothetical protein
MPQYRKSSWGGSPPTPPLGSPRPPPTPSPYTKPFSLPLPLLVFRSGLFLLVSGLPRAGSAWHRGRRGWVVRSRLPRGASSWRLASGPVVSLRSWTFRVEGWPEFCHFRTSLVPARGWGVAAVVGGPPGVFGVDSCGGCAFFPPSASLLTEEVGLARTKGWPEFGHFRTSFAPACEWGVLGVVWGAPGGFGWTAYVVARFSRRVLQVS